MLRKYCRGLRHWLRRPPFSLRVWSLAFAIFMPLRLEAETNFELLIATSEQKIIHGDYASALETLNQLPQQASLGDEQRRLWALAIAHAKSNKPRSSLVFLERLVSLAPENPKYRLELASALEKSGQVERARHHYDWSRGANLTPDLAHEVARRIDKIDRAKRWEGSFEIALTPETNAAKKTNVQTIEIGELSFKLRPESRAKPAQGLKLGFGLAAQPVLSSDLRGRLGFSTKMRIFDGETQDDLQASAELGLVHLGDNDRKLGAGLLFGRRWIDGKSYSSSTGAYVTLGRSIGLEARSHVSFTLLQDQTQYIGATYRNSVRTLISSQFGHLATPKLQLRAGFQFERTDSNLEFESGGGTSINIGAQYLFQGGVLLDLEFRRGDLQRDGPNPFFGVVRKDSRNELKVKIVNRNWNVWNFSPVLEIGMEQQYSTIPIYSYKNTSAAIGLTRKF